MTGGQVHDSQVVGDMLDTPKPPLAITADKAYDSEKVRQRRIATCYDKLARNFLAATALVGALYWIKL